MKIDPNPNPVPEFTHVIIDGDRVLFRAKNLSEAIAFGQGRRQGIICSFVCDLLSELLSETGESSPIASGTKSKNHRKK